MNKSRYINGIVKHIKCGSKKKKDIKKQLLAEIESKLNEGASMDEIVSEMGDMREIADEFNESMSKKDRKQYNVRKVLMIVIPIIVLIIISIGVLYFILPKYEDIDENEIFDRTRVEDMTRKTVELLDASDYASLQQMATEAMQSALTEETMSEAKNQLSKDWGERKSFGQIYMSEISQENEHYVICEVVVTYENVSAIYRITFDQDMKLAGLYIR